jgi:hypothetical protein
LDHSGIYSFVTVTHAGDIGVMSLQARSMAQFLPRELVLEILVVENGSFESARTFRRRLIAEYGALSGLVRFVPANSIAAIPGGTTGWFSQQVLKLLVAATVKTDRYMVLDAKNHLVFPLSRRHIEAGGKPRLFVQGYGRHPLRVYLEPILQYFGLPKAYIRRMLPTTTPFPIQTEIVREMITGMAARENCSFERLFLNSSTRFTEFFTYAAYLLATRRRFEEFYDLDRSDYYNTIWPSMATDEKVGSAIERTIRRRIPFFALHRDAVPKLSSRSRGEVARFWCRRGLFSTSAMALRFLHSLVG